jgi:small-conductance mechanosensitive channel
MPNWTDGGLLLAAVVCLIMGFMPKHRAYRSMLWVGTTLLAITAVYPRAGNLLGLQLFSAKTGESWLPIEFLGVIWWILGAWLITKVLDLILLRTLFPKDNQPHARRLFADLASALIYIVAFVGITDTVLKQPLSAVLATSGVLAIVLGLALQNTLADVFSGLAINIERPFAAGDWICVKDSLEGLVIEVNWRATRIKTASNDLTIVPNSVIARSVVTNRRRRADAHLDTIELAIDHAVPPETVIGLLQGAASESRCLTHGIAPTAVATRFSGRLVDYELDFAIDDFALIEAARSDLITRVVNALRAHAIEIGASTMDVRVVRPRMPAVAARESVDGRVSAPAALSPVPDHGP